MQPKIVNGVTYHPLAIKEDIYWFNEVLITFFGSVEEFKRFIEDGIDEMQFDQRTNSCLSYAIANYGLDLIEGLLVMGVQAYNRAANGSTTMHQAVNSDNTNIVDLLLNYGCPIDVEDNLGYTPLAEAVMIGNMEFVRYLVQKGADINYTNDHGMSILHRAAEYCELPMIELLLELGANPRATTEELRTPADLAARIGDAEVAERLRLELRRSYAA